jgi:hypothetical protein
VVDRDARLHDGHSACVEVDVAPAQSEQLAAPQAGRERDPPRDPMPMMLHTNYAELGADYFDKRNDADARQRYLIRELEKLGSTVTLESAA